MTNKDSQKADTPEYLKKKAFFQSVLTIYGRKPVLEALQDPSAKPLKLHLADSNKESDAITQLKELALKKGAEVVYHSKNELSRISKNAKQDQGVCVDIKCEQYVSEDIFFEEHLKNNRELEFIALDGITNPQNLGMIIRSAAAGFIDGIILPEKGCAQIDPLVIKASAGAVFKAKIIRCKDLHQFLTHFKDTAPVSIITLDLNASLEFSQLNTLAGNKVFVLGNETKGISSETSALSDYATKIPMNNNIESLNVAITAALISFRKQL